MFRDIGWSRRPNLRGPRGARVRLAIEARAPAGGLWRAEQGSVGGDCIGQQSCRKSPSDRQRSRTLRERSRSLRPVLGGLEAQDSLARWGVAVRKDQQHWPVPSPSV